MAKTAKDAKLLASDRRAHIVQILETRSSASVTYLSEELNVTPVTVRSDLSILEQEGKLKRTYGGAIAIGQASALEVPLVRQGLNQEAKERIGARAAAFVDDGDTIMLDGGTTVLEFVKHLHDKRDITLVTSEFYIAECADEHLRHAHIVMIGGSLRRDYRYTYGKLASACIELLHADKSFLSTSSFLPHQGFMADFEPVARVKEQLIEHAQESYMLMDASKVGQSGFIRFAQLSDIDTLVTDDDPDGAIRHAIERAGAHTQLCIA